MIQRIFLDGSCKDGVILQKPKRVDSYLKESCKKKSDLLETFLARNFLDCGISCNILASFCQKNSLSCQIFPQNFQNSSVFSLTLGFLMRNFAELLQSLVLQVLTLLPHTFPRLQKKLCFWQNFPKNGYFPRFLQIFFQKYITWQGLGRNILNCENSTKNCFILQEYCLKHFFLD